MKNLLLILLAIFSIFISLNSYAQEINPADGVRISFLDIEDVIGKLIVSTQLHHNVTIRE